MNILICDQNEIMVSLELKQKIILGSDSLQSHNKVTSESIEKYREVNGFMLPLKLKFSKYVEILRAPPMLRIDPFLETSEKFNLQNKYVQLSLSKFEIISEWHLSTGLR